MDGRNVDFAKESTCRRRIKHLAVSMMRAGSMISVWKNGAAMSENSRIQTEKHRLYEKYIKFMLLKCEINVIMFANKRHCSA